MRKRSSKTDPNGNAKSIVDEAAKVEPASEPTPPAGALYNPVTTTTAPEPVKNPAAVALGKLGGAKGGPARAKALSKGRRAEIAKKAAQARWRRKA